VLSKLGLQNACYPGSLPASQQVLAHFNFSHLLFLWSLYPRFWCFYSLVSHYHAVFLQPSTHYRSPDVDDIRVCEMLAVWYFEATNLCHRMSILFLLCIGPRRDSIRHHAERSGGNVLAVHRVTCRNSNGSLRGTVLLFRACAP
jgi:hypothetical protein